MVAGYGVILRNPGFNLTHEVGAHVGRLGEDTTTHTSEESDGTGPQAKSGDDVQNLSEFEFTRQVRGVAQEALLPNMKKRTPKPNESQTDDAHAHHGTTAEGHVHGGRRVPSGLRWPYGRWLPWPPSSQRSPRDRANGTDDEGHGDERVTVRLSIIGIGEKPSHNDDEDGEFLILSLQECHGAFRDILRDGGHGLVAGILLINPLGFDKSEGQCQGHQPRGLPREIAPR